MPADPTGRWACTTMTVGGQLVGVRKFEIVTAEGTSIEDVAPPRDPQSQSGGNTGGRHDDALP